jgi:uncharacterized protein (DUF486 family)
MLESLPASFKTVALLAASNVFMTFAWYGHLKNLNHQAWYIAAVVSWLMAMWSGCP